MNLSFVRCNKRPIYITTFFIIILFSISICLADWVSFDTGKKRGSVTVRDMSRCAAVQVYEQSCRVSVAIPGAFNYGPDARDETLLKGTTTFSIYGSALEIVSGNINGTFRPDKLGQPDLPYAHMQVLIPTSVTMDQLTVSVENTIFRELDGTFDIGPIQEQLWESFYANVHADNRVFNKDASIYSKNEFFTHEIEYDIAILHGYKFVTIKYCPVMYNPVTKQVMATNTADIVLKYAEKPFNRTIKPNNFTNLIYRSTINGITGNQKYTPIQLSRGGNYAIVSAGSLKDCQTLKDYIAWRATQGYTHVKTVDGSGSASGVTSELKNLYSSHDLEFVLVVGDDKIMRPPYDNGGDKYHYKPWARLDGSDEYEDVMLGIFLCNTESGLERIIQRQKWHEAGGNWTKTFLNTVGAEGSENPMARFSSGHYATRNFDKPVGGLGYKVNRVYQCRVIPTEGYGGKFNIPGPFPWEPWVEDQEPWYTNGTEAVNLIYKYWNEGCFMLQHRNHGLVAGPGTPRIRMSSDITTKCSPFFLSVNCLSGNFKGKHETNFAYLTQQNGEIGTCATIGAPPVTYSGDNDKYIMGLYAGMFPADGTPPERQLGIAHLFGHRKGDSHSRTYFHNYGDVMTMISIGDMKPFITLTAPRGGEKIEVGTTCDITWSDNIPGNVKIDLYKNGSLKETIAGSTASNGSFEWKIALDYETGDDYKVRIISIDSPALYHESADNFSIIPEYILVCPYFQNFDTLQAKTEVLPFQYAQLDDDDMNWTVYNGPTPSRIDSPPDVTGPRTDHTTGTNQGNYIYTEASGNNAGYPNKKFHFVTPKFNFNSLENPHLSFWYHMFSDNQGQDRMGTLYLDISVDGTWHDSVLVIRGNKGDQWHEQKLSLNQYTGDRVILRFRGVTGDSWESDICLDDIKIDGTPVSIVTNPTKATVPVLRYVNSRIVFSVPESYAKDNVRLTLYNMQGKQIGTLLNKKVGAGNHSIAFDSNLMVASGIYHCILECKNVVKQINIFHVK